VPQTRAEHTEGFARSVGLYRPPEKRPRQAVRQFATGYPSSLVTLLRKLLSLSLRSEHEAIHFWFEPSGTFPVYSETPPTSPSKQHRQVSFVISFESR